MVTLAKTLGGGLPSGAIGGTEEVMSVVEDGTVYQVGTFNGNPLTMAASKASLLEVLTPAAYVHLDRINERLLAGCQDVLEFAGDLPNVRFQFSPEVFNLTEPDYVLEICDAVTSRWQATPGEARRRRQSQSSRSTTQSMHLVSADTSSGSTAGNIPIRSWLRPSLR